MRLTMSIAAAGLFVFESARASSPIPSNYVDDFGSLQVSNSTGSPTELPVAHASPILSNYVDDFGSVVPREQTASSRFVAWHASPIPSNFVDDFGPVEASDESDTVRLSAGPKSVESDMIARP